jgi:hypothetical protein
LVISLLPPQADQFVDRHSERTAKEISVDPA